MRVAAWALVAAALAAFAVLRGAPVLTDPGIPFLTREGGAQWVFCDLPFELQSIAPRELVFGFRRRFEVQGVPARAVLTVRAFQEAKVRLDGRFLEVARAGPSTWRTPYEIDLAPHLARGEHELVLFVRHTNGQPGVLAHCADLGLATDASWEATIDAQSWRPARTADSVPMTEHRARAPTGPRALAGVAWLLAIAAAIAGAWVRFRPVRATYVRFALLAAWLVLIVNNLFALEPGQKVGFDVDGHVAYIQWVADEHRLPLATDGWQMFQAPLYYLVAAAWQAVASALFDAELAARMLRLVPLLCGMSLVEIVYRTVRLVWPEREELQALGTAFGGLVPMTLYVSQSPGNEPMAGALSAAAIGAALAVEYGSDRRRSMTWMCVLGALLGAAVLTKSTALLLVPPVAAWVVAILWRRGESTRRIVASLACVLGAAALIGGWYYLRNWIVLGRPFVGGWDAARGIDWWQFPSYRTPADLLSFGDALVHPASPHTMGYWDAMYATFWCDAFLGSAVQYDARPPWNESFLFSLPLLALFPTALMFVGMLRAAVAARAAFVLSAVLVAVYFAAVLDLYLRVPIYSTAKATYTLGLAPAYAVLFTAGADVLVRSAIGRTATFAWLAVCVVAAYAAFFVR